MLFPSALLFFQQFDLLGNALPQALPIGTFLVFPDHVPNMVYPALIHGKFGVMFR
jgi:hypothetical protein